MLSNAHRIHVVEIGSTSDEAKRLLLSGEVTPPFVVRADRQLAGRGRQGRAWWSDAGCLTVTLGLDPRAHGLDSSHWPRLALAAAVGLIDSLEPPLPAGTLGIRWPNDVEAGGRKLAGLLPEFVATPAGPRLALGIGLNVAADLSRAPAEVRSLAVSLDELLGSSLPLDPVLERILRKLDHALQALALDDPGLCRRWAHLDTLAGQIVRIDQGQQIVEGTAQGIDLSGRLLVDVEGQVRAITGGQVLRGPLSPAPGPAVRRPWMSR
jgi:BirA family biotin operon repressor/biotin-[acetyl-CoA-carboxylase] ligase